MLTLDQVRAADFSGVTPLAVLGYPIKHSVSPQMHNAALAVLARSDPKFSNWRYYRIEVPPERLKEALDLLAAKGFLGLNLTIPHKVEVLEFLKSKHSSSNVYGSANTLAFSPDGWEGYNTDGVGFVEAVLSPPISFFSRSDDVVLVGAGGAARAVGAELLRNDSRPYICNRGLVRLNEVVRVLSVSFPRADIHKFDLAHPPSDLPRAPLVVNVTSLGLKADDPSPIDLSLFGPGTRVFDTTYGRHRSALLKQADALGFPASNGLPMLVHQGARSLSLWIAEFKDKGLPPNAAAAMFVAAYSALGITPPHNHA
ncbi:MAG TPA: shikimate dehydrogenase [Opitutales bacterium]|nr:shikimate dehydrogenase [Opitutales bacterium]